MRPLRFPERPIPPRPPDGTARRQYGLLLHPFVLLGFSMILHSCQAFAQTAFSSSPFSRPSPFFGTVPITIPAIPTFLTLPELNVTDPAIQLNVPATRNLTITFNICSLGANSSLLPTVLISTASPPSFNLGTRTVADSHSGGTKVPNMRNRASTIWQLNWDMGFANWTWTGDQTSVGVLVGMGLKSDGTIDDSLLGDGNVVVQIGVSGDGPLHHLSPAAPFFGDSTSTSSLLFSPLLLSSPHDQPSYPNYSLPPAQMVLPSYPSTPSNLTSLTTELELIIIPTPSSPTLDGLDNSLCAVRSANASTGALADPSHMLVNGTIGWMDVGGEEGFRMAWVVGDLIAETNYTAWIVDETGGMSEPIWFSTKEGSFPCQLVLPNPLCPSLAYAAPLPPNTSNSIQYPVRTLPDDITTIITSSLQSFSTSLQTTACGRDLYSHISTCADCHASYRDWVCRVVVPQCASSSTSPSSTVHDAQTVSRPPSQPRNPSFAPQYEYEELLPCLSVCNAVDRSCPVFLGFRCPLRGITANASYAYIGDDADHGDGSVLLGVPAWDRWGNRWCNG